MSKRFDDCVRVQPGVLRGIADTLAARADAKQPLSPAEMTSLALAIHDLAEGEALGSRSIYGASEDNIVFLRADWRPAPQGGVP